jgi:hypothetical protein
MNIENVQGAKYGTGGNVAAKFKRQPTIKTLSVAVHHTREEIGAGVA